MHEELIALFPDLLARHVRRLAIKGDTARGQCPMHEGKNAYSFSANLSRGVWSCHSCGKEGGVVAFARGVGEALPGNRSPSSPLLTVSESLQRTASAGYGAWKLEKYLDIVQRLGESKDFNEKTRLIDLLDRYSLNPLTDETEAKAEYCNSIPIHI